MQQPIKWWHAVILTAALTFVSNVVMWKIAYSSEAKENIASKEFVRDYIEPIKKEIDDCNTKIKEVEIENNTEHGNFVTQKEMDVLKQLIDRNYQATKELNKDIKELLKK